MAHTTYLFVTVLASLSVACLCLTPRNPYSFEPRKTEQKTTVAPQKTLNAGFYCFRWNETYLENGECFEVKVAIADNCDEPAMDTFYVPCDLNVNVNSHIGFWNLRVWDYLYTDEGYSLYYMNRDGSCLRRKFVYEERILIKVKQTSLLKPSCDKMKERLQEAIGPVKPNVVQLTWNEPEPNQTPA